MIKSPFRKVLLLVSFAVALLLSASCDTARESSSGSQTLHSSAGTYEAIFQDVAGNNGLPRQLVVRRSDTHSVVITYPVERHADIVWCPDESAVAILDCFASNESRIVIFHLPSGNQVREIWRGNTSITIGTNEESAKEYSHVYFSDPKWLTPRKMRVNVEMYDRLSLVAPEEYHGVYEFSLAK